MPMTWLYSNYLENALSLINDFGSYSGLRLNIQKSQGLRVNNNTIPGELGSHIKWTNSINVLGLDFYNELGLEGRFDFDFQKYIVKMEGVCEKWSRRKLPIKAKITVLNVLVYPIIYYVASNIACPQAVVAQVRNLSSRFLWNNNPKIALNTLTLPISQGGLGLEKSNGGLSHTAPSELRSIFKFHIDYQICETGYLLVWVREISEIGTIQDLLR